MKKIQDKSYGYNILKRVTIALFRLFYKNIVILGHENIPEGEAPVIFAPTHQNALMDALAVHACYPQPIVFMMRGDVFAHPRLAAFLRFVKIMPVYRQQEGYDTLGKNARYFKWAVDVLDDGKALGMMPEGGQREQRRMRPLVKGIFRIGFNAQEKYGSSDGINIIPVGLDYEDYDRTGKHLIINVGKPLPFAPYYDDYKEAPSVAYNKMREVLYQDMRGLIVHIDDEKNYERYYLATLLAVDRMRRDGILGKGDEELFNARKQVASRFPSKGEELSAELEPWVEEADKYLTVEPNPDKAFILSQPVRKREIAKALLYSVVMIPSLILNGLPYWFIHSFTRKNFSNNGFIASASFIMGFLLYPLYWIIMFIIFAMLFTFLRGVLLFLMVAPVLALICIRIKYIYEDLFYKLRFRWQQKKK